MYRRAILIATAMFISFSALFGVFARPASAAASPQLEISDTAVDAAIKTTERNSLAMCMGNDAISHISGGMRDFTKSPEDIANNNWFQGIDVGVKEWYAYRPQSAAIKCNELNVGKTLTDLGWSSSIQAACDLGFARADGSSCVNGSGDFEWPNKSGGYSPDAPSSGVATLNKQDIINKIDAKYNGTTFGKEYTREQYYVMAANVLLDSKTCNITPIALASSATPDQKANGKVLKVVDGNGTVTDYYYKIQGDKNTTWGFRNGLGGDTGYKNGGNCSAMMDTANENAATYAAWVKKNPSGTVTNAGTCKEYAGRLNGSDNVKKAAEEACNNGLKNKNKASYCSDKYPSPNFDSPTVNYSACVYGSKVAIDPNASTDGADADDATSCLITGIGWFMCPAMNFMAMVTDGAYTFLANYFLSVDVDTVKSAQSSWEKFRDVANVAFVIAIILIIYSQMTSFGISNYGVKRMLPRLAVAALLVNTSFFICMIAVDLSNVIGYAIPSFLNSTIQLGAGSATGDGTITGTIVGGLTWVAAIGGILAGGVALALAISAPVLLASLLAIAMIVFILIARQAIIILLIVVSPLAFVAYLLPNTEQWFKKWYKMFFTMLMLFPIIGVVFGASQLAAAAIYNTGGNGAADYINALTALAMTAIPFFIVPGMLKGALNATGALGQKMQGIANKATGKVGAKVKNSSTLGTGLGEMKKYREQQHAIKYAKKRGTGVIGAVGRVAGGKGFNEKARLRGESIENQEYEEDVKAATENQSRHMSFTQKMDMATGATEGSVTERDAAVRFMMNAGNFDQRRQVLESMGNMTMGQKHSAVGAARAKGDGSIYGNRQLGDLEDAPEGTIGGAQDIGKVLDSGFAEKVAGGAISPELFHRDEYTAKYAERQINGYTDSSGKTVAPNPNITPASTHKLAQSLAKYAATDQGKKVATATEDQATKIIVQSGVTPNIPQGGSLPGNQQAQPQAQSAQNNNQQAPQQQNNLPTSQTPQNNGNQLNIPHNNNVVNNNTTNNTTTNNSTNTQQTGPNLPGTSAFTQSPNGLWVPPSTPNGSSSSSSSNSSANSRVAPTITPPTNTNPPSNPGPTNP